MRSQAHTQRLLTWWQHHGIDRIDLAIRRADGQWIGHHHHRLPATRLLAWVRRENTRCADVFVRPARGHQWPHCYLDDLRVPTARRLLSHQRALIVTTSPRGGCHLHLILQRPIDQSQRHQLQRHLAATHGSDPAATSGCQFARLPGMRNWKRGGCWVNVLAESHATIPPLAIAATRSQTSNRPHNPAPPPPRRPQLALPSHACDRSQSGRDWATVCARLERGEDPTTILRNLIHTAAERRRRDAQRYAQRTLAQARSHLGC